MLSTGLHGRDGKDRLVMPFCTCDELLLFLNHLCKIAALPTDASGRAVFDLDDTLRWRSGAQRRDGMQLLEWCQVKGWGVHIVTARMARHRSVAIQHVKQLCTALETDRRHLHMHPRQTHDGVSDAKKDARRRIRPQIAVGDSLHDVIDEEGLREVCYDLHLPLTTGRRILRACAGPLLLAGYSDSTPIAILLPHRMPPALAGAAPWPGSDRGSGTKTPAPAPSRSPRSPRSSPRSTDRSHPPRGNTSPAAAAMAQMCATRGRGPGPDAWL